MPIIENPGNRRTAVQFITTHHCSLNGRRQHRNDIHALKNPLALRSVIVLLRLLEVSDDPTTKEVNREAHSHLITTQIVSQEPDRRYAIVLTYCKEKPIHNGCHSRAEGGVL